MMGFAFILNRISYVVFRISYFGPWPRFIFYPIYAILYTSYVSFLPRKVEDDAAFFPLAVDPIHNLVELFPGQGDRLVGIAFGPFDDDPAGAGGFLLGLRRGGRPGDTAGSSAAAPVTAAPGAGGLGVLLDRQGVLERGGQGHGIPGAEEAGELLGGLGDLEGDHDQGLLPDA